MSTATERFSDQKCVREISGNWTATRGWDVIGPFTSFSPPDIEDDAINATGVLIGSTHPFTSSLVCKQIGVTENKLTKCIVIANYGISMIVANDPNPLLRAPIVSFKWGKNSQQVDTDINGNPILNSALDAFKSNHSKNFSVRFLRITRYEPFYNESVAAQFVDTINNDSVVLQGITRSPGQVYCLGIAPAEDYQVGSPYVRVTYEFEIRTPSSGGLTALQKRHPFQPRLLDQGLRRNTRTRITRTRRLFKISGWVERARSNARATCCSMEAEFRWIRRSVSPTRSTHRSRRRSPARCWSIRPPRARRS